METVRISVRNLVEFILRGGDLDRRVSGGKKDTEAMQLGARIHRKIQHSMGSGYRAEVSLKRDFPFDTFVVRLEGRADGIFMLEGEPAVDEIKGVYRDPEEMKEPERLHLAQAKCYAYLYAAERSHQSMRVQITYCQMETEQIRRFCYRFSLEELQTFMDDLLGAYERWARFQVEWAKIRTASIRPIGFPFAYREGQKDLAASVYRTILRKKKLFIQAPTGVGKTIAVIFPAVKAAGEGLADKVFYLTAKTVTRTAAEAAYDLLREQGLRWKTVTLTAREKICFQEEANCDPTLCPYARGHFDRVNDAMYGLLTSTDRFTRGALEDCARTHTVCPFELGLDLALWTDGVICDYNYAFDPNACLRRFFGEGKKGDYVFLVDEAHNLVERGREMYSASLIKEDFLRLRRQAKTRDVKLARRLEACNRILLALKKACDTYRILDRTGDLPLRLLSLAAEMERVLDTCEDAAFRQEVLELYFQVRRFLETYDRVDSCYRIYTEFCADGSFLLKLFCVDPSSNLERFLEAGRSTVFFSATFLPIRYYRKLLSTDPDDYAIYARSPFAPERKKVLIARDVSSRYAMRGADMYRRIAAYIRVAASQKKGNYMVFFPSYRFLDDVFDAWQSLAPAAIPEAPGAETEGAGIGDAGMRDAGTERAGTRSAGMEDARTATAQEIDVLCQRPGMREEERESFLAEFSDGRAKSLVGFCVLGGIFSEGIDLAGDRLIGALIVGTGLPQVCTEREILRGYFDARDGDGFDSAYLYPGACRVLQAAGRVIRKESDRGVILLLDDRFLARKYGAVFPKEWEGIESVALSDAAKKLSAFWQEGKPDALCDSAHLQEGKPDALCDSAHLPEDKKGGGGSDSNKS